jgi:hypothetical protein
VLLVARIPHAFSRADGVVIEGTRGVGLCATCDCDDSDASGVLAFFAFHGAVVDDDAASSLAGLLVEWVERIVARWAEGDGGLLDDLDDDHQRWLDNDM